MKSRQKITQKFKSKKMKLSLNLTPVNSMTTLTPSWLHSCKPEANSPSSQPPAANWPPYAQLDTDLLQSTPILFSLSKLPAVDSAGVQISSMSEMWVPGIQASVECSEWGLFWAPIVWRSAPSRCRRRRTQRKLWRRIALTLSWQC